jgi:Ni,Fe-hydrogenase maturation factor
MDSCWRSGCVIEAKVTVAADQAAAATASAVALRTAKAVRPQGDARRHSPAQLASLASLTPRGPAGADRLVIGIGNPLRGDDGVGRWLAQRAGRWLAPAQLRTVQQLTPELAADIALASRVLFIDAWLVPGGGGLAATTEQHGAGAGAGRSSRGAQSDRPAAQPQVRPDAMAPSPWIPVVRSLEPALQQGIDTGEPLGAFSHQLSPGQLLAISQLLLGCQPQAWQLLVPAFVLGHGEGFSPQLTRLLPGAERLLRRWIERSGSFTTADDA